MGPLRRAGFNVLTWDSLLTALYREDTPKSGWGSALYGAGAPAATVEGAISPAGVQTGRLDPHITSAFTSGLATGHFSDEDRAWFDSRGPSDDLVGRVRIPTLMLQGTADTLFTPSESIRNEAILRRNGITHKLIWFCGGHGACLTGSGTPGRLEHLDGVEDLVEAGRARRREARDRLALRELRVDAVVAELAQRLQGERAVHGLHGHDLGRVAGEHRVGQQGRVGTRTPFGVIVRRS